jgi:protein-disulfide isomerase
MSKKTKAEERAAKAAAALAARKRKERRRNLLTVGAILGVIAIIVVVVLVVVSSKESADDKAASQASEYGVSIGDPDAPHEIIIYEDFLCPVCQALEAASRDKLAEAAEDGKVYVSYRPFNLFGDPPLSEYSVASAAAFAVVLEESGAEVALEFHDLLYENQPPESGPYPDSDWLVDLAVEAGAAEADVREGIENGDGEAWVEEATDEAQDRGINSTPTIFLDGEQYQEGRTFEDLADNLVAEVS